MPLATGTRIGPYEILALLGAGGMGEVYRARDSKLNRDVALKVLPAAFANDADRMARFQREAQVLASLNHPNIAAIYGLEDRAIVMELVEGETLAGPLPLETAIDYARQIAEAMEYAHDKGVIHRDLKPANIKITPAGTVKVLDFGLAKALDNTPQPDTRASDSPTLTMGATLAGVILGTAAYMSPEQTKGKPADRRSDIWSFGVVLYEMLTGKQLFQGETTAEILAAVIRHDPDLSSLPESLRGLVARCLIKEPRRRLQAIGEARLMLEEPIPAPPVRAGAQKAPWIVAAAAIFVALALGYLYLRQPAEPPQTVKLFLPAPEKAAFGADPPAVSPDGRRLAFTATLDGKKELWVRDLDALTARPLPGTDGAQFPFWSPDSRVIGFFAGGKLKKIEVAGGPALALCDVGSNPRGGTWNKDDVILFLPDFAHLLRVPAAGGTPAPVLERQESQSETGFRFPWFLPDGRHYLYLVRYGDPVKSQIFAGDLNSKTRRAVVNAASNGVYAAGHILFLREGTLMAQPFDEGKLQTTGDAVPIAEKVDYIAIDQRGLFSVSQNGVLAYTSGGELSTVQTTWYDRSGKQLGVVGQVSSNVINFTSISPDGNTVADDRADPQTGSFDLWLHDLAHGSDSRLTFGPGNVMYPVWSPDGSRIVFRSGDQKLYVKAASGVVPQEVVDSSTNTKRPQDWSRDGRYIFEEVDDAKTQQDIWVLPMFGDKKPFPYVQTGASERFAKLSPNGQWLAYASNETRRSEVYVQTFPKQGGKWQVSSGGGDRPVWSRDGKELYFRSADGKIMAAQVKDGGTKFDFGVPKPLFDARITNFNGWFDVSKDGRFLMATPIGQPDSAAPMTVVLNWPAALKKN